MPVPREPLTESYTRMVQIRPLLRQQPHHVVGAGQAAGEHQGDGPVVPGRGDGVEGVGDVLGGGQGGLGQLPGPEAAVDVRGADVHAVPVLPVGAQDPQGHHKDLIFRRQLGGEIRAGVRQQGDLLGCHGSLFKPFSRAPPPGRGRRRIRPPDRMTWSPDSVTSYLYFLVYGTAPQKSRGKSAFGKQKASVVFAGENFAGWGLQWGRGFRYDRTDGQGRDANAGGCEGRRGQCLFGDGRPEGRGQNHREGSGGGLRDLPADLLLPFQGYCGCAGVDCPPGRGAAPGPEPEGVLPPGGTAAVCGLCGGVPAPWSGGC